MPNWCSNNLSLSHDNPEMISRALKAFEEGTFFNEFLPIPEDQEDNWYEWCSDNWGTKWDAKHGFVGLESTKELELGFDTAWSPPIAFYKKLEELGFTVSANYKEDGMAFIGEYGEGVDECYEYDFSNEDWRDELPEHLVEQLEFDYESWKEYQEQEEQEVE